MKRIVLMLAIFILQGVVAVSTRGEAPPVVVAAADDELLTDAELDLLVGPIALYPDPLIAILLPAATQPQEITMAVRYLDTAGDVNLIDAQGWSESVKALAFYPEVIRWMDENLKWTTQLGEAFLRQPDDVIEAIQRLREITRALGNLQTTPQQIVEVADGDIDILPMDPDFVYVPEYEPAIVFSRPAAAIGGVTFPRALPVGGWLKHDWDWTSRRVVIWNKTTSRPRTWWTQSRSERFKGQNFGEWCPRPHGGKFPAKFWADRAAGKPWQRGERLAKPTQKSAPLAAGVKTAASPRTIATPRPAWRR